MTGAGVRQQYGCFDTHTFIQFSTYELHMLKELTPRLGLGIRY